MSVERVYYRGRGGCGKVMPIIQTRNLTDE